MKETLSTNEVADRLKQDTNAGWSWNGAKALAEWLEQYEEDSGTEMELDIVAIRCDFSEYATALEAAKESGFEPSEEAKSDGLTIDEGLLDEQEKEALAYLQDNTIVIEFEGGVIIQGF